MQTDEQLIEAMCTASMAADPDVGCTWAELVAYAAEHPDHQQDVDHQRRAMTAAHTIAKAHYEQRIEAETVRHKKRGTLYTVIGVGRAQGTLSDEDPVVLYRGVDGGLWVRHQAEFSDGRFERVSTFNHMGDQEGKQP